MNKLEKKISIRGSVMCTCGGVIISYRGKVDMVYAKEPPSIRCYKCKKIYDASYVFNQRRNKKKVKIK